MTSSTVADLVICIPTYNRAKELNSLLQQYVIPLTQYYESRLHVVIADNSIPEIQKLNRAVAGSISSITYHPNSNNLGYGGNIITLLGLSHSLGRYLWFWSDDDEIDLNVFHRFMTLIKENQNNIVQLYTFQHTTIDHRVNNSVSIQGSSLDILKFGDLIRSSGKVIPFLLLSSYAIRSRDITEEVLIKMASDNNDFAHISLLGHALSNTSLACRTNLSAVIYNTVGNPGILMSSVVIGYAKSIDSFCFLTQSEKYNASKVFLRGMLYMVLRFKSNPRPEVQKVFSPYTKSYARLVLLLADYPTIRGIILVILAFFPTPFVKIFISLNSLRAPRKIRPALALRRQ